MIYSFSVSEAKAKQLKEFHDGKRDFVMFQSITNSDDCVFFHAHGTSEGKISLFKGDATLETLARAIVKKIKAINSNIKTVYTISCYGDLQEACEIEGIRFESMHNSKQEIHASVFESVCGDYALDVFID